MRLLLITLYGSLTLVGCVATSYKSVTVDSALPANAETLSRCPLSLEEGQSCMARVQADQWTSPTGIQVKGAGEIYRITVLPNQVWFDADRRNTPPHGEKGSWIMNLSKKRHDAGFFSLMVDVQPEAASVGETAKPVTEFSDFEYTTTGKGKLVLYPNDAIGPPNDPQYYYRNNSGYIWVTIERRPVKST